MESMNMSPQSVTISERGFSLLEILVAITITALLSTAVIASFRIGISSWQRGEEFLDRSQRLSAAAELIQKQIGSVNPLISVTALNAPTNLNKPLPGEPQEGPMFMGTRQDLVFVSGYPLTGQAPGGMQLIRYFLETPERQDNPGVTANQVAGRDLEIASFPVYRREDFPRLFEAVAKPGVSALSLLENIQDATFQYWSEEIPDPAAGQAVRPRLVAYDEWDGAKLRKLPEAVSIQIRFVTANNSEVKRTYNRDSLNLFVPINVSKGN
jgi:prepilin-type N-terminal cleavage/methylation domain-containing protein